MDNPSMLMLTSGVEKFFTDGSVFYVLGLLAFAIIAKLIMFKFSKNNSLNNRVNRPKKSHHQTPATDAPICPSCNIPMVERFNRKQNKSFWGCPNYPKCRHTLNI